MDVVVVNVVRFMRCACAVYICFDSILGNVGISYILSLIETKFLVNKMILAFDSFLSYRYLLFFVRMSVKFHWVVPLSANEDTSYNVYRTQR